MVERAVLISIQPQWCELIASGRKTIEVRKTKPKIPTPFKCYIYCTKGKPFWIFDERFETEEKANGKVIGEFVCYRIDTYDDDTIHSFSHEDYCSWNDFELNRSCIHPEDFESYANGKWLYGWHISELIIYDKPKDLCEFHHLCKNLEEYEGEVYCDCLNCDYGEDSDYGVIACRRTITRPPQSWCYVERLEGEE